MNTETVSPEKKAMTLTTCYAFVDVFQFREHLVKNIGGELKESLNKTDSYNVFLSSKLNDIETFICKNGFEYHSYRQSDCAKIFQNKHIKLSIRVINGFATVVSWQRFQ